MDRETKLGCIKNSAMDTESLRQTVANALEVGNLQTSELDGMMFPDTHKASRGAIRKIL